jgi:hypothetical protein
VVADVDQGLILGWGLGGQAAQALTSINGIVVTHIQRDDLLLLNQQIQCDAVRQVDGHRVNALKSPGQSMQAQGRVVGVHFQQRQGFGALVLHFRVAF